jgi:hypothetical protein
MLFKYYYHIFLILYRQYKINRVIHIRKILLINLYFLKE